MALIVGLGNIGAEYEHTRHNVGFELIDTIRRKTICTITLARQRAVSV
jgi:peptidyl-tRNA hydrolase, PTH1 family